MEPNIIKQGTCILTPRKYQLLRENLPAHYQLICDVLLNTGLRIEEFWELLDHPQWFSASRRCIDIPKGIIRKSKCTIQERTVLLTPDGADACRALFAANGGIHHIHRAAMNKMLRKAALAAGIDTKGIMPKMFRKTLVSWLVAALPEKDVYILASIGHSSETRERHYLSMGFERRDLEEIRRFLVGWGS